MATFAEELRARGMGCRVGEARLVDCGGGKVVVAHDLMPGEGDLVTGLFVWRCDAEAPSGVVLPAAGAAVPPDCLMSPEVGEGMVEWIGKWPSEAVDQMLPVVAPWSGGEAAPAPQHREPFWDSPPAITAQVLRLAERYAHLRFGQPYNPALAARFLVICTASLAAIAWNAAPNEPTRAAIAADVEALGGELQREFARQTAMGRG